MPSKYHTSPGLSSGFKPTALQSSAWEARDRASGERAVLLKQILEENGKEEEYWKLLKTDPLISRFQVAKPFIEGWFKSEWIPGELLEKESPIFKVEVNENLYLYFNQKCLQEWDFLLVDWESCKIAQETLDWDIERVAEEELLTIKEFYSNSDIERLLWSEWYNGVGDGIAASSGIFIKGSAMSTLLFMTRENN